MGKIDEFLKSINYKPALDIADAVGGTVKQVTQDMGNVFTTPFRDIPAYMKLQSDPEYKQLQDSSKIPFDQKVLLINKLGEKYGGSTQEQLKSAQRGGELGISFTDPVTGGEYLRAAAPLIKPALGQLKYEATQAFRNGAVQPGGYQAGYVKIPGQNNGLSVQEALSQNVDDLDKLIVQKYKAGGLQALTPDEKAHLMTLTTERINELSAGYEKGQRVIADRASDTYNKTFNKGLSVNDAVKPTLYHATPEKFDKFDLNKTEGGVAWFTDNADEIKNNTVGAVQGAGQKLNVMKRVEAKSLKWATPELQDKYYTDQLIQMGYDGVKMPSPNGKGNWYKVFDPNTTLVNPDISKLAVGVDDAVKATADKADDVNAGLGDVTLYRGDATKLDLSEIDPTKMFNHATKESLTAFNNTPGIYFTNSIDNAKAYGKNITEVKIALKSKIININDAPKILDRTRVEKIIKSNPNIKEWAANWSENFDEAIKMMTDSVMSEKNGNEFLKAIWADGGFEPSDFMKAMKNAGIDGLIVPKEGVNHFVIYNKDILQSRVAQESIK